MRNRFTSYMGLFGTIYSLIIGFPLLIGIIVFIMAVMGKIMVTIPGMVYFWTIFLLSLPVGIFVTGYTIFFKRTHVHPRAWVRWTSYILIGLCIALFIAFYIRDMVWFFIHFSSEPASYYSLDIYFIVGNVFMFFLIALIQAYTTNKEEDWYYRKDV